MDPLALIIITAQISAAFSLMVGITSSISQAKIASAAIESIARQPAASGNITTTMFISLAMAETNGIYGLLIAIILLFANPLIPVYERLMMK